MEERAVKWRTVDTGRTPKGAGSQAKIKVPVGVLDMRLDIVPLPETSVKPADIARGLRANSMRKQELQRQFFQYSRVWWKEFIDISPTFKNRLVKIFAEDISMGWLKTGLLFRATVRAGRIIIYFPRHAARFVSLIPYTKIEAVGAGAGRAEIFYMISIVFLSMRKGDYLKLIFALRLFRRWDDTLRTFSDR